MADSSGARNFREEGNAQYNKGRYKEAVKVYTEGIAATADAEEQGALYSNRSAALLNLKDLQRALDDAEQAVKLRKDWSKAHWRKGMALEAAGKLPEALKSFKQALKLDPSNTGVRSKVDEVRQADKEEQLRRHKEDQARARQRAQDYGSCSRATRDALVANASAKGWFSSGLTLGSDGRVAESMPSMQGTGELGPDRRPLPDSWAAGLAGSKRYGWLVDAYRMRVSDDYQHGGGKQNGINDPAATSATVVEDFLLFCKMAVAHGVIPSKGWDWAALLAAAARQLPHAFEKADAIKKYGGENYFQGSLGGGRSLRYTAERVIGHNLHGEGKLSEKMRLQKMQERVVGKWDRLRDASGDVFDDVGGPGPWIGLADTLKLDRESRRYF